MRLLRKVASVLNKRHKQSIAPPEVEEPVDVSPSDVRGLRMKVGRAIAVLETARSEKRVQDWIEEYKSGTRDRYRESL